MFNRAQEEMVGFAMIIVVVSVVLLIFFMFSMNGSVENVDDYETESFVHSVISYTTDCANEREFRSVKDLIRDCDRGKACEDGRDACGVLNTTISEILDEAWIVEKDSVVKGYKFRIELDEVNLIYLEKGNITRNFRGFSQFFPSGFEIFFESYY